MINFDQITSTQIEQKLFELSNKQLLILDGSLSENCTAVLNDLLKNENIKKEELAIESFHVNPTTSTWGTFAHVIKEKKNEGCLARLIFSVENSNASIADVVALKDNFSQMTDADKKKQYRLYQ